MIFVIYLIWPKTLLKNWCITQFKKIFLKSQNSLEYENLRLKILKLGLRIYYLICGLMPPELEL